MKAIILAAGMGTRLKKYTQEVPKGMLSFIGKTIIERQIEVFRRNGITDITVVTGFAREKIDYKGVNYYHNEYYDTTNMVESLYCAEEKLKDEVIISYADIIFEDTVLQKMLASKSTVAVAVDRDWKPYWEQRYDRFDFDLESLGLNDRGEITCLGDENVDINDIDGRYVGLIKLSGEGLDRFNEIYKRDKKLFSGKVWKNTGRLFEKIYMTDMLQALIDDGYPVNACLIERGWLEFDTNEDYERMLALHEENKLADYIKL